MIKSSCTAVGALVTGRVGLCLLILVASATANAGPYAEIRAGVSEVDDQMGTTDLGGGQSMAGLSYERKKSIGAEGGMRGIADTPLAVGLALDGFRSRLAEANISGPAASGRLDIDQGTGGQTLSAQELDERGFNFDDRVTVLSGNVYYELGGDEGLVGTLGLGYGVAAIGDADLRQGLVVSLGARFPLDPIGYISVRASRFQADGQTDDVSGFNFENFAATSVTLAFGMEF